MFFGVFLNAGVLATCSVGAGSFEYDDPYTPYQHLHCAGGTSGCGLAHCSGTTIWGSDSGIIGTETPRYNCADIGYNCYAKFGYIAACCNCVSSSEVCDGKDNDCDGSIDEGLLVNGGWSSFGDGWDVGGCGSYSACKQRRDYSRTCNNPSPSCGGASCSGSSSDTRYFDCGTTNGGWSSFGSWYDTTGWSTCSSCSQSKSQQRDRTCNNPSPSCGGASCSGSTYETQSVSQSCGTTNGGWSGWSDSGTCGSVQSCKQKQTRTCNNPSPSCGGASCSGDTEQYVNCGEGGNYGGSTNGWYDSGTYQWADNGVCSEKQQKYQNYRTYTCSSGSYSFAVTNNQWADTGSTRAKSAGTVCRASVGACDIREVCDGSSQSCPANSFNSSSTVCAGSTTWSCSGDCARTKTYSTCTGSSASCPSQTVYTENAPINNICLGGGWTSSGSCGFSAYNQCSGQAKGRDNYRCNGAGSCNYDVGDLWDGGNCSGREDDLCASGSCQDLCFNTVDNDGDGYTDSQDKDCGFFGACGECTSGECCDTEHGCFKSSSIICSTGTFSPASDICQVSRTNKNCSGTSESCSGTEWVEIVNGDSGNVWNSGSGNWQTGGSLKNVKGFLNFSNFDDTPINVSSAINSNLNRKIHLKTGNVRIVEMNVSFSGCIDWSDIDGNSSNYSVKNIALGKSFFHKSSGHSEISNISLFVPAVKGTGRLYVCPNASSFDEINELCAGKYYVYAQNISGYYKIPINGTGVAETFTTKLKIWDNNDSEGGSETIYQNRQAKFFANYSVNETGEPITGAVCNFTENSSGIWSYPISINYNSTSLLYEYSKSFSHAGIFSWDVTCYGNSSYEELDVFDNILIEQDITPPNLTIISPENKTYNISNILVNITNSNDAQSVWWYNGSDNLTYAEEIYYNFSEGSNTITVYANDSANNVNEKSVTFFVDLCVPDMTNTTWSDWSNETCSETQMNQSRFKVEYDSNTCGEIENITYYEYQLVGPSLENTTFSSWYNITECLPDDYFTQERSLTQYDVYSCGTNQTFFEYQNQSCDFCTPNPINSTKTEWINQGSCLSNDTQVQSRSWVEYDSNSCGEGDNVTYWETQIISCDYCTPNMINTTLSDWSNLTCSGEYMNQSQFFIEHDNNLCGEIENITHYNYRLAGPSFTNTTWNDWYNVTACQAGDYYTQERNLTQFDIYECSSSNVFFEYRNQSCDYCIPLLVNMTGNWENITSCRANNTILQQRNITQYDSNSCGEVENTTFLEYREISCDFCTPNLANTSWSDWINQTCSETQMNQSRFKVQYDSNSCGEEGYLNETIVEYNLVGPTLQNTSWTNWLNIYCLSNNLMNQSRNLTQYDIYSCSANQTFFEYKANETCDYCIPILVNTTKTEWQDQGSCLANNTQVQNRSWIEYDSNCGGEVANITYWETNITICDFCTPNLANTSWTEWKNTTSCLAGDYYTQQRNLTQYDSNHCSEIENITHYEYQNQSCDFCTVNLVNTSWSEWYNLGVCYFNNTLEQERNLTQYDFNFCGEIENQTFFEHQTNECDYCTSNVTYTTKTEWVNQGICLSNDTQVQNRSWIEYDSNSCDGTVNQTHWETQIISCDYCASNLTNITGSWENITECQAGDYYTQQQNITQYDSNSCEGAGNMTYYKYRNQTCDYSDSENSSDNSSSIITVSFLGTSSNFNVTQNQFFNIGINVSCYDHDCQNIILSLDPGEIVKSAAETEEQTIDLNSETEISPLNEDIIAEAITQTEQQEQQTVIIQDQISSDAVLSDPEDISYDSDSNIVLTQQEESEEVLFVSDSSQEIIPITPSENTTIPVENNSEEILRNDSIIDIINDTSINDSENVEEPLENLSNNNNNNSDVVETNLSVDVQNMTEECLETNISNQSVIDNPINISLTDMNLLNNSNLSQILVFDINETNETCPIFLNLKNLTFKHNESVNYLFETNSTNEISCFAVDDTTNFNIDCLGYLTNATKLDAGLYWINLSVNDTLNNQNSEIISVGISRPVVPRAAVINSSKGLISDVTGAIPFYTNSSNPLYLNLTKNESRIVFFSINSTGSIDTTYEFFAFANLSENLSISSITSIINITISNSTSDDLYCGDGICNDNESCSSCSSDCGSCQENGGGGGGGSPDKEKLNNTQNNTADNTFINSSFFEKDNNYNVENPSCIPNCLGKTCGDDGCGGSCGNCSNSFISGNVILDLEGYEKEFLVIILSLICFLLFLCLALFILGLYELNKIRKIYLPSMRISSFKRELNYLNKKLKKIKRIFANKRIFSRFTELYDEKNILEELFQTPSLKTSTPYKKFEKLTVKFKKLEKRLNYKKSLKISEVNLKNKPALK